MGMVAQEVRQAHATEDRRLADLEREYRAAGKEGAANHVRGARILLEKARRLAESPGLASYSLN